MSARGAMRTTFSHHPQWPVGGEVAAEYRLQGEGSHRAIPIADLLRDSNDSPRKVGKCFIDRS